MRNPLLAKGRARRSTSYVSTDCNGNHEDECLHLVQVEKFVEEECIPADAVYSRQIGETTQERFQAHPSVIEDLKKRAKDLGLWNMFLPNNHFTEGAGFSNLEYGLMAEYLGKSRTASEVCHAS